MIMFPIVWIATDGPNETFEGRCSPPTALGTN